MGKIITIAPAGAEYVYKLDSAHVVPVSSAEKIRSARAHIAALRSLLPVSTDCEV